MRKRVGWRVALAAILAISLLAMAGCARPPAPAAEKPKVTVGSKGFTEQLIVGNMVALLLENAGYPVTRQIGLGATGICHQALVAGEIDVYVEYSGTGLIALLKEAVITDPDQAYARVKAQYLSQWNLHWLQPWGFNNTYTVTIRRDDANRLGIRTMSDLVPHAGGMIFGCTHEFATRADGLPGLSDLYGMKFKDVKSMDPGLMYDAIANRSVDVISGFATDGRIPALGLVNLADDKNYFPPYHAAPVVRGELLDKAPEVATVLNQLAGKIDDTTMAGLNYEVDNGKRDPADVARDFLRKIGLIK